MRKFSYLISVIFLLTQIAMFAQQFDCQITPSRYTVNRAEKIIWVDLNVYNTEVVKDIKFNVTTTYNSSTISAQPIPARCVNNDGTTDPTKWTAVTKTAVNSASFRYWMAEDVNNYVPKSTNTRCLMEFFIKFTGEIPLTGNLVISFTNFQVIGVNTINSTTMTLTTPVQSGITIDLGATPPDVNDSLQLRTEAGSVNRQTGEARIKLLYKSVIFSFNRLAFNLYPLDLDVKDIEIVDSTGRGWTLGRVGDHYEISISNTDNQGFPPTNANTMLAEIVLSFNPGATGARIIVMNNFQALDLANQTLKVTNSLQQVIDLGQPLPRGDSLYLNGVYLIDELKSEVVVDVYYWGSAWDTLAFNLNLPSGLNLKRFEPGLSSMTPVINGSRLKLSSEIKLPRVAPNDWHHAFSLVLGYNNVQGVKRLIMDNMRAQRGDTSLTVANQPVVVDIDFGNKPNDTTGIVKYSLAINNSWFSLDRPNSRGTISFLWNMRI